MIKVSVDDELIDIAENASFTIGAKSPFTLPGELWGPKVYNIAALDSSRNNRIFQFSKMLNNTNRVRTYPNGQIRLGDLLWKIGTLKLRDFSGAYNFSFHTDAGDIEAKIKNRKLSEVNLGTDPNDMNVTDIFPDANYVHFTVKNPSFFGTANPGYTGYINEYDPVGGVLYNPVDDGDAYVICPFPYLLYLLTKVFTDLGYFGIEGDWTEDENIRRVTVPALYDLRTGTITYSEHVAPVTIGAFLIDTAIFFGITYQVNPVTRMVQIIRIEDWLADQTYTDLNNRANQDYNLEPNESDGFQFTMEADSSDKRFETVPSWMLERIGNGGEPVTVRASPLDMITETNSLGGDWEIPVMDQPGSGLIFGLEPLTRGGLRFMLFDGLQEDSLGNEFPSGHYLRPGMSLRWAGEDGIIERSYTGWMDWKSYTEYMERTVELSLVQLLQLDTQKKIMIDNLKWIIDEYDASVSAASKSNRIKTNLKLYSVRL